MSTAGGHTLDGVIRTLGADFLGLRSRVGAGAFVPLAAITAIRQESGSVPSVGDRVVQVEERLSTVLVSLARERPWVSLHTNTGDHLVGELRTVGTDLLHLRTEAGGVAYVPLLALADLVLP